MYLVPFLGILTIVTGVLGFIGLGYGSMPTFQIIFFIILAITIISFAMNRRKKRKKYYD